MKKILTLFFVLFLSACSLLKPEYTVKFIVDNTTILETTYNKNDLIAKPNDPTKEGFDFEGWFDGETKWIFETNKITKNLSLVAKFTEIEYIDANLNIDNVSLTNGILTWDTVNDSDKYQIIVDNIFLAETTAETYDLIEHKELFTQEKVLKLIAIKGDYESASPKQLKIKFVSDKENVEAYYTGLENDTQGSYLKGDIELDDSTWYFDDALLGAGATDKKVGTRSIRMRKSYIETKFSVENVSAITFSYASFGTQASNTLKLYAKSDTSEWLELTSLTTTTELQEFTFNNFSTYFSEGANIYFKFEILNERTVNIDDISIYHTIKGGWVSLPISDLLSYYDGAEQLAGKNLFDFLNIRLNTDSNLVSYAAAKEALEFADVHPSNNNNVLTIYSRESVKGNWGSRSEWHREHVWPNSRLGIERVKESGVNQASDLHNLRAIIPSINSSRSNRYYTNATSPEYQTVGSHMYYPGDEDKGDVARILFYMVIVYEVLKLSDTVLSNIDNPNYTPEGAVMGQLSMLLAWHLDDPVDDFERNRNEVIFEYQGNRNPFIDQPEWFETIYDYLVSIDEGSIAMATIEIEYQINYSEFIKKREYII